MRGWGAVVSVVSVEARGGFFIGGVSSGVRGWGGGSGMARGHGHGLGRHRAGRGRHGDVPGGARGGVGACWGGRAAREGAGWPGWLRCNGARQVLDSVSAGSAPLNAGRGRGQELRGRVGEHLGSKGKLQDVLARGFGVGLEQVSMGVAISMP